MVPNLQPSSSAMPKNTSIRAVWTSSKIGLTTSIIVSASSTGSNSSKPIPTTWIIVSANSTGIHPTSTVFRPTLIATQTIPNSSQTILVGQARIFSTSTSPTIFKLAFTRSVVSLSSENHPTSKVNHPASIDTRIMSSTLYTSLIFHTITRPRVLHQSTFVLPLNVSYPKDFLRSPFRTLHALKWIARPVLRLFNWLNSRTFLKRVFFKSKICGYPQFPSDKEIT